MTGVYNLNNNVKIADLYKDLDDKQIESIEKASKGGFTAEELKTLEEDGIDTSLIKNNSTKDDKKTTKKTQSDADVKAKAKEIAEKYAAVAGGGDRYSAENPQLQALNDALDDGVVLQLGKEGFTKTQILSIIAEAFPSVGIAPTGEDGSYTRPYGHGAEAQKIYSRFTQHLLSATGVDSEEIQAAKTKLATINNQITSNNHNMQVLEVTIEALQEEVEEQINQAIEDSKDIQDEHKQKAQDAVSARLKEYSSSNGEMTYEQFQQNLSGDLKGLQTKSGRELSDVVCSLVDANHKMSLLKGYVSDLGELQDNNTTLTEEAKTVKTEIDDLVKEAAEKGDSADPQASCTDPIGFTTETARYDFFVDSDNNEDITNEQEFLGAKEGFSEMRALDTDNDGLVTAAELDAENVKVVKTNTDGTQEIVKASEVFKNATDGINLSSYKATNEDLGEGNTLVGTFNATLDGQSMEGYQTLDSNEWLDKNYEFTDEVDGIGRFAKDSEAIVEAYDSSDKINIFTIKNTQLDENLTKAWQAWGFSDDMTNLLNETLAQEGKNKAGKIQDKFEQIARKEEEKTEWSEEEMKADLEKFEKEAEVEKEDDKEKDKE